MTRILITISHDISRSLLIGFVAVLIVISAASQVAGYRLGHPVFD